MADTEKARGEVKPDPATRPAAERHSSSNHDEESNGTRKDADHKKEDDKKPSTPIYRRPVVMGVAAIILIVALVVGIRWWLHARAYEWTDDAFIDGRIVQMSPKVAGYVVQLHVDDNQLVHRGDPLLEIDPRDYESAVEQAEATEAVAVGKLEQADAQIAAAQATAKAAGADVLAAAAAATNALQILKRNEELARTKAIAEQDLITSRTEAQSTVAQQKAFEAKAASADAQVELARSQRESAKAQVREAGAQVRLAKLNLSYTKLTSPIEGRVTNRKVERGDYLQPGQPLFALVPLQVWVTANYKETQLTYMEIGQPVDLRIDAYPGVLFHGRVDSFQRGSGARFTLLPAENATGNYVKVVQRVPVKIVFDEPPDPHYVLGPGMSVVPEVKIR